MKAERVSFHMDDDCPGEPCPQPRPSKPTKPTKFGFAATRSIGASQVAAPERLASTNYSILNETKLRKKMADIGIPNWGTKPLMERRHREWVMTWNANCDSSRPKTKQKLLQDLETWERTQGGHASTSSAAANIGAQIKDKDFDGAGWVSQHQNDFEDLIAQARRSKKAAYKPPPPQTSLPPGAEEFESDRANATLGSGDPSAMDTDELQPVQTAVKNLVAVDLTSPVKLSATSENHSPPEEQHGNVDTVVTPAFVGTHL